jgi:hypothetical protein
VCLAKLPPYFTDPPAKLHLENFCAVSLMKCTFFPAASRWVRGSCCFQASGRRMLGSIGNLIDMVSLCRMCRLACHTKITHKFIESTEIVTHSCFAFLESPCHTGRVAAVELATDSATRKDSELENKSCWAILWFSMAGRFMGKPRLMHPRRTLIVRVKRMGFFTIKT